VGNSGSLGEKDRPHRDRCAPGRFPQSLNRERLARQGRKVTLFTPPSRTGFAAVWRGHSTEELRVVGSQLSDPLLCPFRVGTGFQLTPVVSATVSDVDGQRPIGVFGTEPIALRCSVALHGVPIAASGAKGGHLECLLFQKRIMPQKGR